MFMGRHFASIAFLTLAISLTSSETASAAVKVLNLSKETLYYSQGYLDGQLWRCVGWYSIKSGASVELASDRYYRFEEANTRKIPTFEDGEGGRFWSHPTNRFNTGEGKSNAKEVYIDGKRTSIETMKDKGYKYDLFYRYPDGNSYTFGSYWKVGTVTKSFSHNSSGVKTPQTFSHEKNPIISYTVNVTSSRGVKSHPTWSLSSDRLKLTMGSLTLRGGPAYDPWRPSYMGTVTLKYTYR